MELLKKQEPAAVGAEAGSNSKSGSTQNGPSLPISVSLVKNAIATETELIDVPTVIDGIRTGRWAREVARVRAAHATGGKNAAAPLKKQLPGILWSGRFARRSKDGLIEPTGLLCADIDGVVDGLEDLRIRVLADNATFCAFTSPSGTGLKIVYRVDPNRPHIDSFKDVQSYVKSRYNLEVDPSCSDVSRLCFISHDPSIHYNPEAPLVPSIITPKVSEVPTGRSQLARDLNNGDLDQIHGNKYVFGRAEEGRPPPVVDFNGIRWAALYASAVQIVFDPDCGRFYLYAPSQGLWRHESPDAIKIELASLLLDVARADGHENLAIRKRSDGLLSGWVNHLRGLVERRDVFTNRPTGLLHVQNGFVDVPSGRLLPFSPEYLSRNQSPIPFVPGATCPRFMRELLESALDPDDVRILQRYAGSCLLGRNLGQRLLVMTGTPGGGKGTLVSIIEEVIGKPNVSELRTQFLAERFELFRFVGKSLLCGKDVPGNFLQSKGAHVLKSLVGGDLLEVERKCQAEGLQLRGEFHAIVTSNSRLRLKLDGDAKAWERRLITVNYERPKPAFPIPDLANQLLAEEGPGILNWMIEGARQLVADDFSFPLSDRQKKRTTDLLAESDSVRSFVRDCVVSDVTADLTTDELCEAYRSYCDVRGWSALPLRAAQSQLPDLLMEFHRATRRNDLRRNGTSVRGFARVTVRIPEIADED